MGHEIKVLLALAAGALYVYLGVRKGEAPDWAFDILTIIGVLIVAGVLYKLIAAPSKKSGQRGVTHAPTAIPNTQWGPRERGGGDFSPAGHSMTTTLAPAVAHPAQKKEATLATAPQGFEPDVLAEWTSTMAPGQTSWDSTTLSPKETEIAGFAFGGR